MIAMDISSELRSKGILVKLDGDIDTLTAPEVQSSLNEHMDAGVLHYVIDMENVRYISSMGLRVFLSHVKRLKAVNGSMILAAPNKLVTDVIRLAGFGLFFEMIDDKTVAVAKLD